MLGPFQWQVNPDKVCWITLAWLLVVLSRGAGARFTATGVHQHPCPLRAVESGGQCGGQRESKLYSEEDPKDKSFGGTVFAGNVCVCVCV